MALPVADEPRLSAAAPVAGPFGGPLVRAASARWPALVLLALNVVIHFRWLNPHGVLTYGDSGVYPARAQGQLAFNAMSIQTGVGLGGPDLTASYHPLQLGYAGLAHFGIGYAGSLKLLVLYPYLIVSASASYYLLRQLLASSAGILVGGSVIILNTYTLVLQGGQLLVLMGDALLVLWIAQMLRMALDRSTRRRLALFIVTGFALTIYEFRIFYIGAWIIGLLCLYVATLRRTWVPIYVASVGIAVILALNSYWLLPLGKLGSLSSNELVNRGLFGSQFFDLASSVTLFHRFWTGEATAVFVRQPIPAYAWFIPAAVAAGVVALRRRPVALFFVIVGLLGIFLTKEAAPPFPHAYQYLYDHLPGFNVFREASKFYVLTAMSYAVFFGAAADVISSRGLGTDLRRLGVVFFCTLLACVFVVNARPLISGSFGTMFVGRVQPAEYRQVNGLLAGKTFFRTLWLPAVSRWAPYDLEHPAVGLTAAMAGPWAATPEVVAAERAAAGTPQIAALLQQRTAEVLLNSASVRYLVVPVQDPENSDDVFNSVSRTTYVDLLEKVSWLHRVSLPTTALAVYENPSWAPAVVANDASARRTSLSAYDVRIKHLRGTETVTLGLAKDAAWLLSPSVRTYTDELCPKRSTFSVRRVPLPDQLKAAARGNDTWSTLAKRLKVPLAELLRVNNQAYAAGSDSVGTGRSVLLPSAPADPGLVTQACADGGSSAVAVGFSVVGSAPDHLSDPGNSWMNTWTMSPALVMSRFPAASWRRNADGSLDVSFRLIYAPQATFNVGLLISLTTLVLTLAVAVRPSSLRRRVVVRWRLLRARCRSVSSRTSR